MEEYYTTKKNWSLWTEQIFYEIDQIRRYMSLATDLETKPIRC